MATEEVIKITPDGFPNVVLRTIEVPDKPSESVQMMLFDPNEFNIKAEPVAVNTKHAAIGRGILDLVHGGHAAGDSSHDATELTGDMHTSPAEPMVGVNVSHGARE